MAALYLSRARLRPGRDLARLGPILFPDGAGARAGISHRLVWSLFPHDLVERPFLYRETAAGAALGKAARGDLMILSSLVPEDRIGLFDLETKPFQPLLAAGDRLGFALRANPAVNRRDASGKTRRHDVVMHALHTIAAHGRAAARPRLIREAGIGWLAAQADAAGFRLADPKGLSVDGYVQVAGERGGGPAGAAAMRHSRLDFEGALEVTDPQRFLARVAQGFGRARAFGHGLMLIRRA